MDKNFKIYKLRAMGSDELATTLEKFREELFILRSNRVTGATAKKLGRIKVTPFSMSHFVYDHSRLLERLLLAV